MLQNYQGIGYSKRKNAFYQTVSAYWFSLSGGLLNVLQSSQIDIIQIDRK